MSTGVIAAAPAEKKVLGVSRNVFFLGWVSFLTDISSEMLLTVLPFFLANVLGAKTSLIGLIEGIADSTATLTRLPSGWLSDRIRRRKTLTMMGYGVSAVSKPLFIVASSWGGVLGLRFLDRVGKGVRTAPRDALIADSTAPGERGKSFGFHRALDTAGAVTGILGAALVVYLAQGSSGLLEGRTFQIIAIVAAVPAFLGLFVLWRFVREAAVNRAARPADGKPVANVAIPFKFKLLVAIMIVLTLANSSDAFLILRAQNVGLGVVQTLLLVAAFNLVYASMASPLGRLSDRVDRRYLLIGGWALYALVYLGFALAGVTWHIVVLFLAYGLFYAATDGVGRALVADYAPSARRGTAFGWYNTAIGITALPASLIAGVLWQAYGPRSPFIFGAALAGVGCLLLFLLFERRSGRSSPIPRAA